MTTSLKAKNSVHMARKYSESVRDSSESESVARDPPSAPPPQPPARIGSWYAVPGVAQTCTALALEADCGQNQPSFGRGPAIALEADLDRNLTGFGRGPSRPSL